MDVYLVPVARDNHEPYCEVPDEPEEPAGAPDTGFFGRIKARFSAMLAEAERERRQDHAVHESRGVLGRVKARTLRYVA
jgi:hypothetical protein